MSYVVAVPEVLAAAVLDVEGIGSALSAAHAAAAFSTTQFVAAGGDEVPAAIAALFGEYGQAYQVLSAQASVFHARFVQTLDASAGQYVSAEAANVSPLQALEQDVLGVVNAHTELLLGRPLIGNGINATIPGGAGGAGALLYGSGGNGAAGLNSVRRAAQTVRIYGTDRRRVGDAAGRNALELSATKRLCHGEK
jgi:hypothetical protein